MKKIILLVTLLLSIVVSATAFGADKKPLIVYFSRADENYNVGSVSKGSTEIVAEIIAKETGADLFKIEPVNSYPASYNETVRIARDELRSNARPKIKNKVNNLKDYDVVFVGYPIWHGDLPMVVYTFFNENNLSEKTIILFSTHEGSGLAGTESAIRNYTKGKVVDNALSIRGKRVQDSKAETDIKNWIKTLKDNKTI